MKANKEVECQIRRAEECDLDTIIDIGKELGFNQYKYLNHVMNKIDPDGIIVAEENGTGRIVGMCVGVNLSPDLAFIGQYGLRPSHQRRGIGTLLWKAVLEHIGPDRNIGLYARTSMAPKYASNGFPLIPDRKLCCFIGAPNLTALTTTITGISVSTIDDSNIDAVLQYDRQVCDGLDRRALIQQFPTAPELATAVAMDECQRVRGYGVICRSSTEKAMVEGLYADEEVIAEVLIFELCRRLSVTCDQQMIYYCWNCNHRSISLAEKIGLSQHLPHKCPIMFSKNVINGDLNRIFSVSSRAFYPF